MVNLFPPWRCAAFVAALILPVSTASARTSPGPMARHATANVDLMGTVTDSTNSKPLQSAEIAVVRAEGGIVATATTDAFGRFTIHNLATGSYSVSARLLGFRPITRPLSLSVPPAHNNCTSR